MFVPLEREDIPFLATIDFVDCPERPSVDRCDWREMNRHEGAMPTEERKKHRWMPRAMFHCLREKKRKTMNNCEDLFSTWLIGQTWRIERINTRIAQWDQWTLNIREVRQTVNTTVVLIIPILQWSQQHRKRERKGEHLPRHWIDLHRDRPSRDRDSIGDLDSIHWWSSMCPREQDSQWYPMGWWKHRLISMRSTEMKHSSSLLIVTDKYRKVRFETECTIHCQWWSQLDQLQWLWNRWYSNNWWSSSSWLFRETHCNSARCSS